MSEHDGEHAKVMGAQLSPPRVWQVLEIPLLKHKPSNALDVAYAVEAKLFLTEATVAAYIDLGWRGGFERPVSSCPGRAGGDVVLTLPRGFSWLTIALQVFSMGRGSGRVGFG